ncbi:MAG: alpha/beta hydrolase [Magnetococcales bacterium]|nr:alpha/beta hydrolase [Magnetococcales bacterium]
MKHEVKHELIWVHGWVLGPGMWRGVTRHLPRWNHQLPDLGFFSKSIPLKVPATPWVGIGHSLGFLWLLEEMRQGRLSTEHCLGLVSINGFSRFHRGSGLTHGVHPRILRGMEVRCREDPEALLHDFRQKAGLPMDLGPVPMATFDQERVLQGLHWLGSWDNQSILDQWNRPLLVLAGTADTIVSPSHTRELFAQHPKAMLCWLDNGGHMLPLTHPAWCLEHLLPFLERCMDL